MAKCVGGFVEKMEHSQRRVRAGLDGFQSRDKTAMLVHRTIAFYGRSH